MFGKQLFRAFERRRPRGNPSPEERAVVRADFPKPASVPEPTVLADGGSLSLRYRTEEGRFAVIRFRHCNYFAFGAPNDEALGGHPLGNRGLTAYTVHEVQNSSLIQQLEQRNSVHHRHDPRRFLKGLNHFIFTFQDATLECVVKEVDDGVPVVSIFDLEEVAVQFWRASIVC